MIVESKILWMKFDCYGLAPVSHFAPGYFKTAT